MHIRSGDTVKVLTGVDRGKTGEVHKVYPDENRALVKNVNYHYKAVRQQQEQQQKQQKGIIQKEMPVHASNLQLVCPACDEPTRTGRREHPSGQNARYCKSCDEFVDLVD